MPVLVVGIGLAAVAVFTAARPGGGAGDGARGALPSEAEARSVLAHTYERAKAATDPRTFCESSGYPLLCRSQYHGVGGLAAVPTAPPKVIGTRADGSTRVLTVCGVDGFGRRYYADFPVERAQGWLQPIYDVFWDSKTFHMQRPGETIHASPRPPISYTC